MQTVLPIILATWLFMAGTTFEIVARAKRAGVLPFANFNHPWRMALIAPVAFPLLVYFVWHGYKVKQNHMHGDKTAILRVGSLRFRPTYDESGQPISFDLLDEDCVTVLKRLIDDGDKLIERHQEPTAERRADGEEDE